MGEIWGKREGKLIDMIWLGPMVQLDIIIWVEALGKGGRGERERTQFYERKKERIVKETII